MLILTKCAYFNCEEDSEEDNEENTYLPPLPGLPVDSNGVLLPDC